MTDSPKLIVTTDVTDMTSPIDPEKDVILPIIPGLIFDIPDPAKQQFIPAKYESDRALMVLSEKQNGVAILYTQRDSEGNRAGYKSQYPIDLTDYDVTVKAIQQSDLTVYAKDKLAALVDGGVSVDVGDDKNEKIVWAKTDSDSRTNLSGLVMLAQMSNTVTTTWVQSGGSLTLDAAEIVKVGMSVGNFVQACYAAYSGVQADIDTGLYTTNDQIDKAPWPSTSL